MWKALFEAVKSGFEFFGRLLARREAEPEPIDAEEPTQPDAARGGTAAGAAAHDAGHAVEGSRRGKN